MRFNIIKIYIKIVHPAYPKDDSNTVAQCHELPYSLIGLWNAEGVRSISRIAGIRVRGLIIAARSRIPFV
jgi:hypothetical protein